MGADPAGDCAYAVPPHTTATVTTNANRMQMLLVPRERQTRLRLQVLGAVRQFSQWFAAYRKDIGTRHAAMASRVPNRRSERKVSAVAGRQIDDDDVRSFPHGRDAALAARIAGGDEEAH